MSKGTEATTNTAKQSDRLRQELEELDSKIRQVEAEHQTAQAEIDQARGVYSEALAGAMMGEGGGKKDAAAKNLAAKRALGEELELTLMGIRPRREKLHAELVQAESDEAEAEVARARETIQGHVKKVCELLIEADGLMVQCYDEMARVDPACTRFGIRRPDPRLMLREQHDPWVRSQGRDTYF